MNTEPSTTLKPLREQTERTDKPKVSVLMITYNHEHFIAEAIESVLNQVTDFAVELIIGEDASNDNTLKIIKKYAEKYSNVIKLLPEAPNMGMHENFRRVLTASNGEYIALLEGDDYWTESSKLIEQIKLLELDTSTILCAHKTIQFNENNLITNTIPHNNDNVPHSSHDFMIKGGNIHTSSMVFKNYDFLYKSDILFDKQYPWIDYSLKLLLADKGNIGYIDKAMSAYRSHVGGVSHMYHKEINKWINARIKFLYAFDKETNGRNRKFIDNQINKDINYLNVKKTLYNRLSSKLKYIARISKNKFKFIP